MILDDDHEETRRRIRQSHTSTSMDHLVAGFKGLGLGFYGGAISIFKQTYEGTSEGIPVSRQCIKTSGIHDVFLVSKVQSLVRSNIIVYINRSLVISYK